MTFVTDWYQRSSRLALEMYITFATNVVKGGETRMKTIIVKPVKPIRTTTPYVGH